MTSPSDPVVSVIVTTYQGVEHIERCLVSLARQDMAPEDFEVIVVLNGPDDGTERVVERFRSRWPVRLRTLRLPEAGAGLARQLGTAAARGTYLTSVDDDDWVSPNFLSELVSRAEPNRIVVAQMVNTSGDDLDEAEWSTYHGQQLLVAGSRALAPDELPSVLAYDAGKLVLTRWAQQVPIDTSLPSGQDIVYWATLCHRFPLEIVVVPPERSALYHRLVRTGSVSRPTEVTYSFAVTERLAVMERLTLLPELPGGRMATSLRRLVLGQVGHIRKYLRSHPEALTKVLADIAASDVPDFPYAALTKDLARDLAICYVFVPANDTSAFVATRRLLERGRVVDVISQDSSGMRVVDDGSRDLALGLVDKNLVVGGSSASASWGPLTRFCREGEEFVLQAEEAKGPYRSLYSRAMWPASHLLAALLKARRPELVWTAEFSDPLTVNTVGRRRQGTFPPDAPEMAAIAEAMRERGYEPPAERNVYEWIEWMTYALADEILFTNANQLEIMLEHCSSAPLRERVRRIAQISAHPTPPASWYTAVESSFPLADDRCTLGYFGNFYANRSLGEVFAALRLLSSEDRSRLRLYIFTSGANDLTDDVADLVAEGTVVLADPLPYLEFLHLCRAFDVLVINDAQTRGIHRLNPYLPSKLSDYRGSGADTWALVEEGSVLSQVRTTYRTALGDVDAARDVLQTLANATARPLVSPPKRED